MNKSLITVVAIVILVAIGAYWFTHKDNDEVTAPAATTEAPAAPAADAPADATAPATGSSTTTQP